MSVNNSITTKIFNHRQHGSRTREDRMTSLDVTGRYFNSVTVQTSKACRGRIPVWRNALKTARAIRGCHANDKSKENIQTNEKKCKEKAT